MTSLRGFELADDCPVGETGECFQTAVSVARWAESVDNGFTELTVCHGLPRHVLSRLRFWHAWVEAKTDRGWLVIDRAGRPLPAMRRPDYYRAGDLKGIDLVWRWTLDDAHVEMLRRKHWGPWVDHWERYEQRPIDGMTHDQWVALRALNADL